MVSPLIQARLTQHPNPHTYELDADLHTALEDLVQREQRQAQIQPAQPFQAASAAY
jgi:hypothetical protein